MPTAVASLGPLQKAVAALLSGNAAASVAFMTLIGKDAKGNYRVYDQVPEPPPFTSPTSSVVSYVTIFARDKPWFSKGRRGREATVEFEVWSRYEGFSEANDIVDALVLALDHVAVTVMGFAQTEVVLDLVGPQERMPDGLTRHIAVYFTVHLEQS